VDEDDVGTYVIKSIDDPRSLNKTIYIRPPGNIFSQNELIAKWEKLSGKVLEKIPIPSDEFLASMEGKRIIIYLDEVTLLKMLLLVALKWSKGYREFLGKAVLLFQVMFLTNKVELWNTFFKYPYNVLVTINPCEKLS
jgi:hypothetical protein